MKDFKTTLESPLDNVIENTRHGIKKYELTDEVKTVGTKTLHRIKALKTFNRIDCKTVKAGDLGGWIENEYNLSHEGNCWVADDAWVFENAQVYGDAIVCENAKIYNRAEIYCRAKVGGEAQIYKQARVNGRAFVHDHAQVYGNAVVCADAQVYGDAWVYEKAIVSGFAQVYGSARVTYEIKSGKVFLRPSDPGMSTAEYNPDQEYFSVAALMTPIDRFAGSFNRGGDFFLGGDFFPID